MRTATGNPSEVGRSSAQGRSLLPEAHVRPGLDDPGFAADIPRLLLLVSHTVWQRSFLVMDSVDLLAVGCMSLLIPTFVLVRCQMWS